nr:MAG TPA: hypothetical protein [Caudoviricetes sp.]
MKRICRFEEGNYHEKPGRIKSVPNLTEWQYGKPQQRGFPHPDRKPAVERYRIIR